MNFLSHFYLVQDQPNPYLALGMVLPDMTKNHRKQWIVRPQRKAELLSADPVMAAIARGWKWHVETDRFFHSSNFFQLHSSALRKEIIRILPQRPYRPFFLAHIALELLLDHLLLTRQEVDAALFYRQLRACDENEIIRFLRLFDLPNPDSFSAWYRRFLQNEYLYSYREAEGLANALDRTGRRVWEQPIDPAAKQGLTELLLDYKKGLETNYFTIFEEISSYLRLL